MKLKEVISDYLSFNRAEQRGIAVLLAILLALLAMNRYWPSRPSLPDAKAVAFEKEIRAFSEEIRKAEQEKKKPERPKRKNDRLFAAASSDTGTRRGWGRGKDILIDINTADTMELQLLRGIGPGFARRITGYRNKLGGYVDKRQLLEVYGMDADRYAMIRDHVKAGPGPVRKLNINTATFKELISHPYFPYELTREILLQRKKIRKYDQIEDLKSVQGVTDSVYFMISPYVTVD